MKEGEIINKWWLSKRKQDSEEQSFIIHAEQVNKNEDFFGILGCVSGLSFLIGSKGVSVSPVQTALKGFEDNWQEIQPNDILRLFEEHIKPNRMPMDFAYQE